MQIISEYESEGTSTLEHKWVLLQRYKRTVTTSSHTATIKGTAHELKNWASGLAEEGATGVRYTFNIGRGWWDCTWATEEEGEWEED